MSELHQDSSIQRLEQRLADLHALVQVITEVNRSLDLDYVLRTSLKGIQRVVHGDFGCFLLVETETRALRLAHSEALPLPLLEQLEPLTRDTSILPDLSAKEDQPDLLYPLAQRVRAILKTQDIEHYALIPLTAGSKAVGVLLVGIGERQLLEPPGIDLLLSIGEQVGMAVENARLHARVKESEEWHRLFIENSLDGFWEIDSEDRITYVNNAACKILGFERAALLQMRTRDLMVEDTAVRLAAGKELHEKSVLVDFRTKVRAKSGEIKTLHLDTRVVRNQQGQIACYQSILRDVTEQERLLEALNQSNQELAALNAIANILNHPLEIERSLDQVCEQIASITSMETAALYLMDESGQFLTLLAYRGLGENTLAQLRRIKSDGPVTRIVAVQGKPFAVNDVSSYLGDRFADPRAEGYHAVVGVPILRRGVPVGAISVSSKTKAHYAQAHVDLLSNIGNQVGIALENANLYAQMQRRVEELDGLAKLSAACTSSLDPQAICRLAVEWTQKLLRVDACSIRLIESGHIRLGAVQLHRPETRVEEQIGLDEMLQSVIEKRIPRVVNDLEEVASPWRRQYLQGHGLRATLSVPMPARDHVIGMLSAGRVEAHRWSQHEIDLLQTIANQAANAIDNAQLFQKVLSEQHKVQAIFDSGISGLFATDAQGRIVMFNRAAERITGWTLQEVHGRDWADLFAAKTSDQPIEPLINEALLRKQTAYVQSGRTMHTRDGRVIPVAEAVAPLLDEKDNTVGAVGALWDLSREQAAELTREHFLTMVAHQLRSPLTALLSALQLLERQNLSEERRAEMWAIVKSDGERLRKFADEFLDMEAVVKSPHALSFEPLSIAAVARRLVKQYRAGKSRHHFRVRVSKPEPTAYADPDRVEHILRNLLDNAVTYSPVGSRITVSVRRLENNMVEVAVQDQGLGIPFEDQERVFKPFYRPKSSGRRVYGHGLGLPLAREMVKEMGGTIRMDSEENRGSTFYFTLPGAR